MVMTNEPLADEPMLDHLAGGFSRAMATRFTRRSFFGKVGLYATAAVVGGTASTLLWQEPALAATCTDGSASCNGATTSVTCQCLTGLNTCPSGTCECGCWTVCNPSICAFPNAVAWCDCCNTSRHSAGCACGKPKNCFPKEHFCSTCGCNPGFSIRCRKHECVRPPTCL